MKAVITVIGKDTVGIIAKVSTCCARYGVNILDITQSVLQDYFAMVMLVDISDCNIDFSLFIDEMTKVGHEIGLDIRTMHEDIFNSMHRI